MPALCYAFEHAQLKMRKGPGPEWKKPGSSKGSTGSYREVHPQSEEIKSGHTDQATQHRSVSKEVYSHAAGPLSTRTTKEGTGQTWDFKHGTAYSAFIK
eukprot:scaffold163535_cov21-Tisochrysis_lutea.AAC.1